MHETADINSTDVLHQILVNRGCVVTAVRERIERKLDVVTEAFPYGPDGGTYKPWAIRWTGPKLSDEDFDFLRPDVLPPRKEQE